jgi:hypothetical protein
MDYASFSFLTKAENHLRNFWKKLFFPNAPECSAAKRAKSMVNISKKIMRMKFAWAEGDEEYITKPDIENLEPMKKRNSTETVTKSTETIMSKILFSMKTRNSIAQLF